MNKTKGDHTICAIITVAFCRYNEEMRSPMNSKDIAEIKPGDNQRGPQEDQYWLENSYMNQFRKLQSIVDQF